MVSLPVPLVILGLSAHPVDMAFLAIIERKSDTTVAQTAVFPLEYLEHRVSYGALFDTREDVRVTNLAAVP